MSEIEYYIPPWVDLPDDVQEGDTAVFTGGQWVASPGGGGSTVGEWHVIGDPGEPTLEGDWVSGTDSGPFRFRLEGDVVRFAGSVGLGANSSDICQLPPEFAPLDYQYLLCSFNTVTTVAPEQDRVFYVNPSGMVQAPSGDDADMHLIFDGVTYPIS